MSPANNPGQSLIDGLPPEIAKRINPDWQKNEAEYWKKRDSLVAQYSNPLLSKLAGFQTNSHWFSFVFGRVFGHFETRPPLCCPNYPKTKTSCWGRASLRGGIPKGWFNQAQGTR